MIVSFLTTKQTLENNVVRVFIEGSYNTTGKEVIEKKQSCSFLTIYEIH